ncbi:uncharacterized protein LOC129365503 isoform X1 [Poeciliopsis prolifica]|uniref:uncharacterized protein LOC129365503 isoform X1 n=1 Tax=Poeciliopsis prolifica TaxID=188132 RepID=UPI00241319A6|nr:uncharacterized protein LOC129365503 isoform X1 [Poeciliopsis prolifica]
MELWKKAALFTHAFLFSFCCAVDLLCTVKRDGSQMVHSISLESHASGFQSATCDSTWSNETTMLSTSSYQHSSLMTNSFHTLERSDCHDYILWKAQCWSAEKMELTEYTANCTTTCAVMNLGQVGDSKISIYPIIGVLLLLGMLGLILSYKFKADICRFVFFPSVTSLQKPNVLRVVKSCCVLCSQDVNIFETSLHACTKSE